MLASSAQRLEMNEKTLLFQIVCSKLFIADAERT